MSICSSICSSVPPLGHPARPEAQPARHEALTASRASCFRPGWLGLRPGWISQRGERTVGDEQTPQKISPFYRTLSPIGASSLASWASGLASWASQGGIYGQMYIYRDIKSPHSTGHRSPPPRTNGSILNYLFSLLVVAIHCLFYCVDGVDRGTIYRFISCVIVVVLI